MDKVCTDDEVLRAGIAPSLGRQAIGVGCIWFAIPLESYVGEEEYFETLRNDLDGIENLTNLKITGEDFGYGELRLVSDWESENPIVFPHVYDLKIEFDLFISYKVQQELHAECLYEKFSVIILSHYHFPVTYIISECVDGKADASSAIVTVRKYLEKKLKGRSIVSGCVGPSPFHADFFCVNHSDPSELIDVTDAPGYTQYEFRNDSSLGSPIYQFSDKYGENISLFYELCASRASGLNREREIISCAQELLDSETGIIGSIRSSGKNRLLIDRINRNSLREELNRSGMLASIAEARDRDMNNAFADLQLHFREIIRFSERSTSETSNNVALAFEERRKSFISNVSVLLGALLGGMVGSFLTYLLAIGISGT